MVSRHGNRSPERLLKDICPPLLPNLLHYESQGIKLSGMTGLGMRQVYNLGVYTKQRYVDSGFLQRQFLTKEVYVRAVGSERTIQSGVCWAQGLYPAGVEYPIDYDLSQTFPVPVYTEPDTLDNLLEIRKGACRERLGADTDLWDQEKAPEILHSHPVVKRLSEACGFNLTMVKTWTGAETLSAAVKDITDAISFDFDEARPVLLHGEEFENFRELAEWMLMDRLLGTDEQVTYMNGMLPETLIENFRRAKKGKDYKLWAYHGHREMTYALGKMLGLEWDFRGPGMPLGAVPPGTTVFFELHKDDETGEFYVQNWVWAPCGRELDGDHNRKENGYSCPPTLYTLKGCHNEQNCPLKRWNKIFTHYIAKTGTWNELCNYTLPGEPEKALHLIAGHKRKSKKELRQEAIERRSDSSFPSPFFVPAPPVVSALSQPDPSTRFTNSPRRSSAYTFIPPPATPPTPPAAQPSAPGADDTHPANTDLSAMKDVDVMASETVRRLEQQVQALKWISVISVIIAICAVVCLLKGKQSEYASIPLRDDP